MRRGAVGAAPDDSVVASPAPTARGGRRHDRWIVLAAFAVVALTCLGGEKIDINGGFGWDGATYGQIASDPYPALVEQGAPLVLVHRIGPSLLVNLLLRSFFSPIENAQIVWTFILGDVVGITLACWLVIRTIDAL